MSEDYSSLGWRGLWHQMREYGGRNSAEDALLPWVEGHQQDVDFLRDVGRSAASDHAVGEE